MQTEGKKRKWAGEKSDGEPSAKRNMSEDIKDVLENERTDNFNSSSSDSELSEGIADDLVANEKNDTIDNGPQEVKQFRTNIFSDEMKAFSVARNKSKKAEEKFIQEYIKEHEQDNVITKDDVYSLLLTTTISLGDVELTKYILNVPHKENILTYVDDCCSSPISVALLSRNEEILDAIAEYIESKGSSINKPNMSDKDMPSIISVTSNPAFKDMLPIDCYRTYLEPLYSEKSLKDLVNSIGLNDFFDQEET